MLLLLQRKRKCYNVEAAHDDSVSIHSTDIEVICHLIHFSGVSGVTLVTVKKMGDLPTDSLGKAFDT